MSEVNMTVKDKPVNFNPEIEGGDVYARLTPIIRGFEVEGESEGPVDERIQTLLDAQDEIEYLRNELSSFRGAVRNLAKDYCDNDG